MKIPDQIQIDCKYTTKGYLQVEQWSAKEGIRTPPINGNSRHDYYHSRIVEALKAENEQLRKERDDYKRKYENGLKAYQDLLMNITRESE